jgi:chaperonin GroES
MQLKPLGHRILIQPDAQDTETASGLVLPEDRDHVPVSGTVIAIGSGPARDQKIRSAVAARCFALVEELAGMGVRDPKDYMAAITTYRESVERFEPVVQVGDRVVYPQDTGLAVTQDGTPYVLMQEDDVAIVASGEVAA